MKNLEQIRATLALTDGKKIAKRDATKLPALIVNNGLLAAVAFAAETNEKNKPKRPGMKMVMDSIAGHLGGDELGIVILHGAARAEDINTCLTQAAATSLDHQRATTEALAYLSYLKRFASKASEDELEEG